MKIEYYHASKYGNGAAVAHEFRQQMATMGVTVNIRHVREARPRELPEADLYLISSPGRFGKPIGDMKRFLKHVELPPGTRYAVLVTELRPGATQPESRDASEEDGKCQQVIPFINGALQKKGLVNVAEGKVFVTGLKGPLEEGWHEKVADFVSRVPVPRPGAAVDEIPADSQTALVA